MMVVMMMNELMLNFKMTNQQVSEIGYELYINIFKVHREDKT